MKVVLEISEESSTAHYSRLAGWIVTTNFLKAIGRLICHWPCRCNARQATAYFRVVRRAAFFGRFRLRMAWCRAWYTYLTVFSVRLLDSVWYGIEDDFSMFHTDNFLPFHFYSTLKIFHSIQKFSSIFHFILPYQRTFRPEVTYHLHLCNVVSNHSWRCA